MAKFQQSPPKLALKLINFILPESLNDDIAGDLTEEFYTSDQPQLHAQLKFWQQTLSVCALYASRDKAFMTSMCLTIFTAALCYFLINAVMFLSFADHPIFYKDYWLNGNAHLFFIDPVFWSTLHDKSVYRFEFGALIDLQAYAWSITSLVIIFVINRYLAVSAKGLALLACVACAIPYLYGIYSFRYIGLDRQEAGPMIALMWISVIYMIIPMSFFIVRALYKERASA